MFPEAVKDTIGTALSVAQFGGKHPSAKPWKGLGLGVFEVVKSHRGIRTPRPDVELVEQRLKLARADYKDRYGQTESL